MPRNRYADKAHTEARINGQTITGKLSIRRKEGDGPHPLSSLLIAARGLSDNPSPADWVRSNAKWAEDVANGREETIASRGGFSQPVLDALRRCIAALD